MIKDINIRFNLDKEEHKRAWDYMQNMDRTVEKSYSKIIIKSLIRYFESIETEDKAEMPEDYWKRFRNEIGILLQGKAVSDSGETEQLAEKEENNLPEISDDVMDALDDLF